jgi:hypothetical protein
MSKPLICPQLSQTIRFVRDGQEIQETLKVPCLEDRCALWNNPKKQCGGRIGF